jgi:hypothetical protein
VINYQKFSEWLICPTWVPSKVPLALLRFTSNSFLGFSDFLWKIGFAKNLQLPFKQKSKQKDWSSVKSQTYPIKDPKLGADTNDYL